MKHQFKKMFRAVKKQKLKLTEMPFQILESRTALAQGREQKIPKNVYQTFKFNSFGKTHFEQISRFRELNQDLNFIFFDEDAQDSWMENNWIGTEIHNIYKKLRFGPARADIFRYCSLYAQGGYYFDISKGCKVPLTSLHSEESECLISYEQNEVFISPDRQIFNILEHPEKYILQWGFGFTSGHPFLKKAINNIELEYSLYKGRTFENPKTAILMFTGPGQFTKSVRQVIFDYPDLSITQAGIDFNRQGIFSMKGSEARYLLSPAYANSKNSVIVD
jgi:mannosyltransferase OCH1-like enzyme